MIQILVRQSQGYLTDVPPEAMPALLRATSFRPEGYQYTWAFKNGKTDGRVKLLRANKFPAGLLKAVTTALDKQKIPFVVRHEPAERAVTALDFALSGIQERDYQTAAVEAAMIHPRGVIRMPTGSGKRLALDTPIPTPTGWTNMGDLRKGDLLFDESGRVCSVVIAHPVEQDTESYEVLFSNGERVVADGEHLWETWTWRGSGDHARGHYRVPAVVTTKEMRDTLLVSGRLRHAIPVAKPLDLPEADLPVHPYVLGAWLGDGHGNGGAKIFSNHDEAPLFAAHIRECGYETVVRQYKRTKNARYYSTSSREVGIRGLRAGLNELGLLDNKHIPPMFLRASIAQRRALLQGLMDTDGSISKRGDAELITKNQRLRDGAVELLRSLGYKPTHTEKTVVPCASSNVKKYGTKAVYGPYYRITFKPYSDEPCVTLPHKVARLRARPQRPQSSSWHYVASVTPVDTVPMRCITVSAPSSLYLCGQEMIPTHNSAVIARVVHGRRAPALIVVPTIDLLYQQTEFLNRHLRGVPIGQLGDGVVDPQPVTVATIKTAAKAFDVAYTKYEFGEYDDSERDTDVSRRKLRSWIDTIDTLCIDECHLAAAKTLFDLAAALPASCKYGFSASPWRDDGADLMIEAATGPVIYRIGVGPLVEQGFLVPPIFRMIDTKGWWQPASWGARCARCKRQRPIAQAGPIRRCACGSDQWRSEFTDAYRAEIVENVVRNQKIADIVNNELQGPTLVLVKQIKHGRALADLIPGARFLSGKDPGAERAAAFDDLRAGNLRVLVCTVLADMGLDLPILRNLVLAGLGKSSTRHLQRIGRIVRPYPGKSCATVVDLDDSHASKWFRSHVAARRAVALEEWEGVGIWV